MAQAQSLGLAHLSAQLRILLSHLDDRPDQPLSLAQAYLKLLVFMETLHF